MSSSLISFLNLRTRDFLQQFEVEHDDGAMFEANPVASSPGAQLLVDALAGHADHLADFLLGDRDGAAALRRLVPLGETDQGAGKPARQILQDDLFDLVRGPAQPRTQQFDEFHRQRRLAPHEWQELAAVDDENLAIAVGGGICGPRLAIEHGDFADNLAGADQVENRAAAVGDEMLIFTVPDITAIRLFPGSPLEKIAAPRFRVPCLA